MNQIVNTLISAICISRRNQATNDLHSTIASPMIELSGESLALIAGGDGMIVNGGPRGGWSTTTLSAA